MKVAVVNIIRADHLIQFEKDGVKEIIFTRIDKSVDYDQLSARFKLINAFENTSGANWYNFNKVVEKTARLSRNFPRLLNYQGYNLDAALNKDLFWAYLFKNALLFETQNSKSAKEFIFYDERSEWKKRLALFRKLFLYKHKCYEMIIDQHIRNISNKIAFRLNDPYMIDVYGNLFEKLGKQNVLPFQSIHNSDTAIVNKQMLETFGFNFTTKAIHNNPFRLSFADKVKLFFYKEDADFMNTLIYLQNTLCNHIDEYERLFKSGVKKVILNAGENEGEGNVVCLVAKKHNGITFNYMNGTKAKDPQNMNSFFDYWFMPDKNTKDLLLSYCEITDKQLPVTGHVLQDNAELHKYSGTLDAISDKIKDKKIIALLTSRIYALEKQNVLSLLTAYLEKHKNVIVLVRKHPSESDGNVFYHERIIAVPPFTERLVQKSLFDLFKVSDLAISFSSMVSYQASWFNIPSLNYELTESSRLPFVDDKLVFHVNNLDKLEMYLDDFLFNGKTIGVNKEKASASQNIADILLEA